MTSHPSFARTDHRPWPLPAGRWTWRQSWLDLLFAHWPVPAELLRPLVPPELTIQEFDGTSWVGVVPFRMEGVAPRLLPDIPWVSAFPELNLRLYVEHGGYAGVWFLSLDAANPLAVWAARRFFHLPYFHASMRCDAEADGRGENDGRGHGRGIDYESVRRRDPAGLRFAARYRPTSAVYASSPGSLEHWLTERYCLFARSRRGQLFRADIHHLPWPLQAAEAEFEVNEIALPHGIGLRGEPALLHFARRIDVAVWSPVPLHG